MQVKNMELKIKSLDTGNELTTNKHLHSTDAINYARKKGLSGRLVVGMTCQMENGDRVHSSFSVDAHNQITCNIFPHITHD